MASYPFLPTQNTAPSGQGLWWNFSELAFQDAVELAAIIGSQPSLQGNATATSLIGQLVNDTVVMALEESFTTRGQVSSDTLNDFDNTLLEFGSFAGTLGISSYFQPLYYQSSSQYNPASALSGVTPGITTPSTPSTPSTPTG